MAWEVEKLKYRTGEAPWRSWFCGWISTDKAGCWALPRAQVVIDLTSHSHLHMLQHLFETFIHTNICVTAPFLLPSAS